MIRGRPKVGCHARIPEPLFPPERLPAIYDILELTKSPRGDGERCNALDASFNAAGINVHDLEVENHVELFVSREHPRRDIVHLVGEGCFAYCHYVVVCGGREGVSDGWVVGE